MPDDAGSVREAPTALLALITVAVASLVANLYYGQPLIAAIAPEIGVSANLAGAITSVAQVGYGIGLFLLVSLSDLVETKAHVLVTMGLTAVGLVGVATSSTATSFFLASFVIGLSATSAQVLLPFAAHFVPEHSRGRVVGNIMGGVLTGIMLARPVALFVSAGFGWRAVFWASSVLVLVVAAALAWMMPRYRPQAELHYGQILRSMLGLFGSLPAVRWRSLYGALLFGGFNMFWTAIPLMLAARFGLSEHAIGLFALAGAGGALAAPFAGRLADRGLENAATLAAMLVSGLAFLATIVAGRAGSLAALVVLAVIIDAAVQTNQVVSRRTIFGVPTAVRGRVNAIYMTVQFIGGALGSVLGSLTFHDFGWSATALTGAAISLIALGCLAIELRGSLIRS